MPSRHTGGNVGPNLNLPNMFTCDNLKQWRPEDRGGRGTRGTEGR